MIKINVSRTHLKRIVVNLITTITLLSSFSELYASPIQLKDVPIGSVVYDATWEWEFKPGADYTGVGPLKNVEWLVVAKNHNYHPDNSVTLMSKELIGKYRFSQFISGKMNNRWHASDINDFLNQTFYGKFGIGLKGYVLNKETQRRNYVDFENTKSVSISAVYMLSVQEMILGKSEAWNRDVLIEYFNSQHALDNIIKAKLNGITEKYWGITPKDYSSRVEVVGLDGDADVGFANDGSIGVRPSINLMDTTSVVLEEDGRYRLDTNQAPSVVLDSPTKNQIVDSLGVVTIKGMVQDKDNHSLTVSASIGGVTKSVSVEGASINKPFNLTWNGAELSHGTYTNIQIDVTDQIETYAEYYTGVIQVDKIKPKLNINIKHR